MNREIGSEFWDVPVTSHTNCVFPRNTQWFASGRSALKAIIHELAWAKTVAIPTWCCDSIIKPFVEAGITVRFYPTDITGKISQNIVESCDILLLVDLFGFYSQDRPKHKCVIRDITHSIFSESINAADYYFGSLRKWCGMWSGGFAWSSDNRLLNIKSVEDNSFFTLRKKAMSLKKQYIANPINSESVKQEYLSLFNESEQLLQYIDSVAAAKRDVELASILDVSMLSNRRHENAKLLMHELNELLLFKNLDENACPLFVPILVDATKRNYLQKYLAENHIYCPIHWPISKYHQLDSTTKKIYLSELSLVCDQRYSESDMRREIALVKKFLY